MTEDKKRETTLTILSLWEKKQGANEETENWLKYKQILEEAKKLGLSQRTVVRYLNALVKEGKLDRDERGYKKTFYRPTKDFWAEIEHDNQQYRISEKSLESIGRYVMETLSNTIAETKTAKSDYTEVWEKINELSPEDGDTTDAFTKAMDSFFKSRKLTQQEKNDIHILIISFLNDNLFRSLTNPTIFSRVESEYDLPSMLEDDIWNLVKSFMDIWSFIYKHPGAVLEIENLRNTLSKGLSKTGHDRDKQEQAKQAIF